MQAFTVPGIHPATYNEDILNKIASTAVAIIRGTVPVARYLEVAERQLNDVPGQDLPPRLVEKLARIRELVINLQTSVSFTHQNIGL